MKSAHAKALFRIILSAFICLLLVFPSTLQAVKPIADDPLVYSALVSLGNASKGSGFYINDGKYIYFITAHHVLFKCINNNCERNRDSAHLRGILPATDR